MVGPGHSRASNSFQPSMIWPLRRRMTVVGMAVASKADGGSPRAADLGCAGRLLVAEDLHPTAEQAEGTEHATTPSLHRVLAIGVVLVALYGVDVEYGNAVEVRRLKRNSVS